MKRTEYDRDIFPERVQCQMSKTPSEAGFGVLINFESQSHKEVRSEDEKGSKEKKGSESLPSPSGK